MGNLRGHLFLLQSTQGVTRRYCPPKSCSFPPTHARCTSSYLEEAMLILRSAAVKILCPPVPLSYWRGANFPFVFNPCSLDFIKSLALPDCRRIRHARSRRYYGAWEQSLNGRIEPPNSFSSRSFREMSVSLSF